MSRNSRTTLKKMLFRTVNHLYFLLYFQITFSCHSLLFYSYIPWADVPLYYSLYACSSNSYPVFLGYFNPVSYPPLHQFPFVPSVSNRPTVLSSFHLNRLFTPQHSYLPPPLHLFMKGWGLFVLVHCSKGNQSLPQPSSLDEILAEISDPCVPAQVIICLGWKVLKGNSTFFSEFFEDAPLSSLWSLAFHLFISTAIILLIK